MLEFACGRSGRGKTQYIFDSIKAALARNDGQRIYLIVPDQMSFQTEYALLQQIPQQAMMRVEVVGISRFVTQMIGLLNGTNYMVFESLAQKVLLLQAGLMQKKSLDIYRHVVEKPEFITYLQQFSRALRGSGLLFHEALPYASLEQTQPLLFKKLQETDQIFSYYQAQLEPLVFDIADKMRHYLSLLYQPENQEKLKQINLYIDGFYTFNNLEVEVLAQTLQYVNEGKMTFAFDVQDRIKKNSIFWLIRQQFNKFSDRLDGSVVRIDTQHHRFAKAPLLSFIEAHYEQPKPLPFEAEEVSPLDVTVYETIEQEVIGVAQAIRQKIIFEGVRAKELAVYVPQKALYTPLIEKYFALYDIPYYLDVKDSMLIHPVFNWLFSLLQVIKHNWQIADILQLLQNDFFRYQHTITEEDYYLFVDFVGQIKYPYKRIWAEERYWLYYDKPDRLEDSLNVEKTQQIVRVKTMLTDAIAGFSQLFEREATTSETVLTRVFKYIQAQNVYAYITAHESHKAGAKYLSHVSEVQYQEAVWKQLLQVFDQIHIALGNQPYQKNTLVTGLLLGLEEAEFTGVPQSFDALMVGDFARTKFQTLHQEHETKMGVQYAFILGVNDQFVPRHEQSIELISPEELQALQAQGLLTDILLQDEALNYQRFHFYTLLTSAAKEVHISYYQYGGLYLEEEYFPSAVLKPLLEGFDVPFIVRAAHAQERNLHNMTIAAAKHMLMREYNRHAANTSDLWRVVEAADGTFIRTLTRLSDFKNDVGFTKKIALPEQFSVSQVETYNRCAYQYFLKYVLKVKEPYEEKMQPFQTGVLLHGAYELLAEKAQKKQVKVNELDGVYDLIRRYFAGIEEGLSDHPLFNLLANRYMYAQTQKIVEQSLPFILKNEANSQFVPEHIEYQLQAQHIPLLNTPGRARLVGKLDRIDVDKGRQYLRIIDYKSSRKSLDFNGMLHGTQLQLPVYAYLTQQAFAQKIAGSLYVPLVENDLLVDTPRIDAAEVEQRLQKTYQATGFVLDEPESLVLFDEMLADDDTSTAITYNRTKDGKAGAHAMALAADELASIQKFAFGQVKTTIERIVAHEFPVAPTREDLDDTKTPCSRCAFRSVCQFDQTINRYSERENCVSGQSFAKKKEQFFALITDEKGEEHE
jgi:ATP-dependent helicase/nuclease subunit B